MIMSKHAYLIMAHAAFGQLRQLITLLDDSRNDIFIHIDSKAGEVNYNDFMNCVKCSQIFFTKRRSVTWGGDSQVKLEMDMIEDVVSRGQYEYLHLLSGMDFPIKSKKFIFDFFDKHKGCEFVMIDKNKDNETAIQRCNKHYFFQNKIGRENKRFYKAIQQGVLCIEGRIGYSRIPSSLRKSYHKGPNWFSITGEFAKYVISRKDWVSKNFSHTICADEVFLQTLLWNSHFRDNIYVNDSLKYSNLRITDWQRGNPYVWQNDDIDFLIHSPYLFARKFDTVSDNYIYNRIKHLN